MRSKVLEAARRAVELDDTNVAAHNPLSHAYAINGRYAEGEAEAKPAIDLNPIDPTAHAGLGIVLTLVGRPGECAVSLDRLNLRHPRVGLHLAMLARAYLDARQYEEATDQARQAMQRGRFNMAERPTYVLQGEAVVGWGVSNLAGYSP